MNILFITPSYKPAYIYGGTIVVVAMLAEELVKQGHQVTVLTTTANGSEELSIAAGKETIIDGVKVIYFKRNTGDHTHVSFPLWNYLRKEVKGFDAVHIHSWWNFLVLGAAWICKQRGVVPILSPHGMFSNYILETNNSNKKKWLHKLIGRKLLRSTRLHVSTTMEWDECKRIMPEWQGAVVPNLVVLPAKQHLRKHNEVFTIGFLSRVDPKKGLDILIRALSQVRFSYRLLVAGSGEKEYVQSLKELSERLGNSNCIEWVGWKNGEDKFSFFSQLDLFALTSHSENFAIVVIESLAVGTPVLISKEVGLFSYVLKNKLGWVTDTDANHVCEELEKIYQDKRNLQCIQANSINKIKKDFDPVYLTQEYVALYKGNQY